MAANRLIHFPLHTRYYICNTLKTYSPLKWILIDYALVICDHWLRAHWEIVFLSTIPCYQPHHHGGSQLVTPWQFSRAAIYCIALCISNPHYEDNAKVKTQHIYVAITRPAQGLGAVVTNDWCTTKTAKRNLTRPQGGMAY